jgi:hypothetical protein
VASVAEDSRGAEQPLLGNSEWKSSFMRAQRMHARNSRIFKTTNPNRFISLFITTITKGENPNLEFDGEKIRRDKPLSMQSGREHTRTPLLLASTAGQEGSSHEHSVALPLPLASSAGQRGLCHAGLTRHTTDTDLGLIEDDGISHRFVLQPPEQNH